MRGRGLFGVAAAALAAALVAASAGSGAGLANSQTYTDPRADAAGAVDLTRIVASNDDKGVVTFRLTLDRPALAESDSVDLYLDTDRQRSTGERGSDVRLSVQGGAVRLMRLFGGEWHPVSATTVRTSTAQGVLTVSAAQRELERVPGITRNPGFNFYVTTTAGAAAGDVAPEAARTGDTRYAYAIKIADKQAPTLKALASTGKRGTIVKLKYTVHDRSGKTRERVVIHRGTAVVARVTSSLGPSQIGVTYYVRWRASTTLRAGTYRFCVRSTDLSGNQTRPSCASLRLT